MKHRLFIDQDNGVVVVSTYYRGCKISGKARCHPEDEFSVKFGTRLAKARMQEKLSKAKARRLLDKADSLQRQAKALEEQAQIHNLSSVKHALEAQELVTR